MNLKQMLSVIALLACCGAGGAQPLALPAPPRAAIEQRLGAHLPLNVSAADDTGLPRHLADYFDGQHVVVLVPGYYRCPELCGLLMHGLLEALQESGVPRTRWRIVGFSIDPEDTPADARNRRNLDLAYADWLLGAKSPDWSLDLHLLTLARADATVLARSIGYRYETLPARTGADARFAHPAGILVVTPQGVVSRYFNGIQFDAAELRVALADAAGDRVGGVTSRIALLCAHFDPQVGRHSGAVMNTLRIGSLLLVAGLAAWCWRRRGTRGGGT